tara:strand:- start:116932 stop:117768 length:837 start_codon:yes stop_codon:yes gene_type:complete
MDDNILNIAFWTKKLQETYLQFKTVIISYVPNVMAALVILLAGWLLAKVARYLGLKLGLLIFRLISVLEKKLKLKSSKDKNKLSKAFGGVLYWIVIVYFIFFALKMLNLPGVTLWLVQLFALTPTIISSVAIIFLGVLFGSIAKQAIYSSVNQNDGANPYFIAQSVQFGIITVFITWGVGQIGINISILTNFISIILAAIFGAAALGFGMGSSSHVANLIASYNLKRNFNVGEKMKINDVQGVITDITNTAIIIETEEEGTVIIPAKLTNDIISYKAS